MLAPQELNVPEEMFEEKFGLSWQSALASNVVFNAMDACEQLALDEDALDRAWGVANKAGKLVKFGGSVALSLCTTVHSLHTKFAKIFGTCISEATMRRNPR